MLKRSSYTIQKQTNNQTYKQHCYFNQIPINQLTRECTEIATKISEDAD